MTSILKKPIPKLEPKPAPGTFIDPDPYKPTPRYVPVAKLKAVHPYPDGKRVLLIAEDGEKIIYELGTDKHPMAAKAYEKYRKANA